MYGMSAALGCQEITRICIHVETASHSQSRLTVGFVHRVQVQVAAARLAQATGSYPGNFAAAEVHMRQAVEVMACICLILRSCALQTALHMSSSAEPSPA